jgi:uncharacterized paraquat-inducible protein A
MSRRLNPAGYKQFLQRWKDDGNPVTPLRCPHCKRNHDVPRIPNTDTMAVCPNCDELFFKVIDGSGNARASVPGVPA